MKKMLLATALALLITGCAQQTRIQKQTGSSSTKETITHHFFVSGIGQKTYRCNQNLWRRRNVVKTKPANIRKWIYPGLLL